MRQDRVRNIAVALKLAGASGRDLLNGISTYAREHCHWRLRIFSRSEDFTPAALAEIHSLDGIITSERGANGMSQLLERSSIPLVVIGMKDEWLSGRTRQLTFVRNDDEDIGRFAASHLLSLGNFRSFGFVPSTERTYWSLLREKGFRSSLRSKDVKTAVYKSSNMGTDPEKSFAPHPAKNRAPPKRHVAILIFKTPCPL